jgi:hypothetical protein
MVAVRSTRRYAFAEKFWIVSENTLLLPTMVRTLSGVLIVVPKRPISSTVPVTPPAVNEITDLERPQEHQERTGGEVREQPAPRHADRDAAGGDQRRECCRLDAEVAEDCDDQHDIEHDGQARLHVARQRGVEILPREAAVQQAERESNQPATDEPQGERARNLPGERGQRDDGTLREGVDVHGFLRG